MGPSKPVYSIVDIETTGSSKQGNKIIEIAILKFDGEKIIDRFESFVHPEKNIPTNIVHFTGITDEMVFNAPKFYEIAKRIVEMCKDTIFVAHNVYFDFNFLKHEFLELGYTFQLPKLCTVRLARSILKGHASYSLGNICKDLNIEISQRHRAMGDASATLELFKMLLAQKESFEPLFEEHEQILLPPNLNRSDYDSLPELPGVYRFLDDKQEILYIGKSKNLKKRVASHFRLNVSNRRDRELKAKLFSIQYELTGNDLCALLLECHYIKTLRPTYNRALKSLRYRYHVKVTSDPQGFIDLKIETTKPVSEASTLSYHNKLSASQKLLRMYRKAFGINENHWLLEKQLTNFKKALGKQTYNERLQKIIDKDTYPSENFFIQLEGRRANEKACLFVVNSKMTRIDYLSNEHEVITSIPLNEDDDLKRILLSSLEKIAHQIYV